MIKKVLVALAAACAIGVSGFAVETNYDKGELAATVGLNFGWGIGVGGGVEFGITRFDIAEQIPITIGAAGRAALMFASYWGYDYMTVDAGGFVTGHVSLKGLDLPEDMKKWSDKLDYYIGLGVGLNITDGGYFDDYGWDNRSIIGFASMSGVNYYLNDNIAINLEGGYLGWTGYGLLGITFKL